MSPKSILVLVDGGPQSDSTLETGLAVAALFGARVQALHVQADPATLVPIVGEGMSGAMVEQVMDAMAKAVDQRAQKARVSYEKLAGRGAVTVTWRQEVGPEPVVLAAAGRLADLTVLDRDFFTIPDADIRNVRSVLTIVGGKVVHDSGALKV